jgi:hypothetical protein
LDEKQKAEKQEEIKKVNNPTPDTKPEDFARKEILLYADREYQTPLGTKEEKALLHYLMKVPELTKEEKKGLFNFMVTFFEKNPHINEVFGYDGNKIDPKAFAEKFSDLEFTMPSDLVREKLNKNKEEFKKGKKTIRKEHFPFQERRARRKKLKSDFKETRTAIKSTHKSLKEQSKANRRGFRADKRKIRNTKGADKNYRDKLKTRRSDFKDKRREIREEKRQDPVFLRGLWQKSRNDSGYDSIKERLETIGTNRASNQANVKLVEKNKRDRSHSAFETKDKNMLAFAELMERNPNLYLDAYELENLRRTEGDTEKLQVKSVQFYETYFKGNPNLGIGYQSVVFDKDPLLFYEKIVLPGHLFKAFPEKYYPDESPSKPSEVKDDLLRFWYQDDFTWLSSYKNEGLENQNKVKSRVSQVTSNIPSDKLNLDMLKLAQANPENYIQAYKLQETLYDDNVPLSEKQEQLYAFYKLYEKQFNKADSGFSDKEALWAKWGGNPMPFFRYLYPAEYFYKDKLASPQQRYKDLWEVLQTGMLDTLLEEFAVEATAKYAGGRVANHLKKKVWPYGATTLSALILSDALAKNSNIFKTLPEEWGILPAYLTAFYHLDKKVIDRSRTVSFGETQRSIQNILRYTNNPDPEKGIGANYASPPGITSEIYPKIYEKNPKKMSPSVYSAMKYNFSSTTNENSVLKSMTNASSTIFGQVYTPMSEKTGINKKTYDLLTEAYPFIQQNTLNLKNDENQTWSFGDVIGRSKINEYLNSMPDSPLFNYGFGLSLDQRFQKNYGVSAGLNYAGVNTLSKTNEFKRFDLLSFNLGTSFNADLERYWKIGANLNYSGSYTPSLTPNPNASSQDAINGVGQQHVLSGNVTIGNGRCEFTGSFSDDLMRGKEATTFSLKFSLNQIADIPKGTFSAQVFMDKRAAIPGLQVPSMLFFGGKLILQLGEFIPHQPK